MQSTTAEFKEEGVVNSIDIGALRDLYVVNIHTEDANITIDVVKQINIFNINEKYQIIISKTKPNFSDNDFCGHGYIVTEKKDKDKYITIVSLYGLIVRIESKESFLNKFGFNIMDHIYFCALKS
ncbi:DNA-directed RNA polymerase subunit G [Acidianus sulfidivorans JP7]|uniref:DNA-directed RNA polymerase subunit Rpo8 n=1 Tax=Acidianus sulfidivorans JP7 TaxID=619593 RepID=A0A2U9IMJ7_9CREN|nr:DNA-directed RNA polymerase subunit G [Acidianus sulfidivorans]AWR97246.1 DNA-directed RNA polymerase subunit G [Acidianus sulfidivorans JP7]